MADDKTQRKLTRKTFKVQPRPLDARPGFDFDDVSELLELLEDFDASAADINEGRILSQPHAKAETLRRLKL